MRRRTVLVTGIAVVAAIAAAGTLATGAGSICDDLQRSIDESVSGFATIEHELIDGAANEWSTTFVIRGASDCSLTRDVKRASYQCEWEYELGDTAARTALAAMTNEVASCLGQSSSRGDDSVNHPDFFAAQYFEIDHGQVSVSLKDKNALAKTYVTVGVDRITG